MSKERSEERPRIPHKADKVKKRIETRYYTNITAGYEMKDRSDLGEKGQLVYSQRRKNA